MSSDAIFAPIFSATDKIIGFETQSIRIRLGNRSKVKEIKMEVKVEEIVASIVTQKISFTLKFTKPNSILFYAR